MSGRSIALLAFFVILCVSVSAEIRGFALGARTGGGVAAAKEERFPAKAQLDAGIAMTADFPVIHPVYAALALGLHRTMPSSLDGGFQYRGFSGPELRLGLQYKSLALEKPGSLVLLWGLYGGSSFRLDCYEYTDLHFFYPGMFLEPFLKFQPAGLGRHCIQLCLPLDLFFRKDMELFASAGLLLMWKVYPWARVRRAAAGGVQQAAAGAKL